MILIPKRPRPLTFAPRPLTFAPSSFVGETPQTRAKAEREYKEIVREAVRCFGVERVAQLNKEVAIARRGKKPNRSLNDLLRTEWEADPVKDPKEFSEAFYQKYPQQAQSAPATKKRLERQSKAWEKERKLKALLQRPSLIGGARGTE